MGVFGAQGGEAPIVRHTGDKVFARLRFGVECCAKSDLSACDPTSSPPHSGLWPSRSPPLGDLVPSCLEWRPKAPSLSRGCHPASHCSSPPPADRTALMGFGKADTREQLLSLGPEAARLQVTPVPSGAVAFVTVCPRFPGA